MPAGRAPEHRVGRGLAPPGAVPTAARSTVPVARASFLRSGSRAHAVEEGRAVRKDPAAAARAAPVARFLAARADPGAVLERSTVPWTPGS